jgi:hypothetical protein
MIPILSTTRISGGALFTPASISGLKQWVEAGRFTGFSDGDAIATPTESSGSGIGVSATGTGKPLYKTNIVSGNPAMLFDGTDDLFVSTSFTMGSLVIAAKYTLANFNTFAGLFEGVANLQGDIYFVGNNGNDFFYPGWRTSITPYMDNTAYVAQTVTNAWHVFSMTDSSPQAEAWRIGEDRGLGRYWTGYIYGWAAYDTALSAGNRKLVEQYFGRKVGVTIS